MITCLETTAGAVHNLPKILGSMSPIISRPRTPPAQLILHVHERTKDRLSLLLRRIKAIHDPRPLREICISLAAVFLTFKGPNVDGRGRGDREGRRRPRKSQSRRQRWRRRRRCSCVLKVWLVIIALLLLGAVAAVGDA